MTSYVRAFGGGGGGNPINIWILAAGLLAPSSEPRAAESVNLINVPGCLLGTRGGTWGWYNGLYWAHITGIDGYE